MLYLNDDEADLALMALLHLRDDAGDAGRNMTLTATAARRCCWYVVKRVEALIERIEQWKKDEAEERADADPAK